MLQILLTNIFFFTKIKQQSLIQALQSDKERFPNNYWAS